MSLSARLKNWERELRNHYNVDPRKPENERRARIYNDWFDHAILRRVWTNFYEIAPGVFRSNQPTHKRFVKIKDKGISHVLNLRGESDSAHYYSELQSCEKLGLTLINCPMNARHAVPAENILRLIQTFKEIPHPFVMHCKSGADRAGFASAVYLMVMRGETVQNARKMLSVKYIHLKFTRTGIQDYILRTYQARLKQGEISFEDWIAKEYDHTMIQENFNNKKPITA